MPRRKMTEEQRVAAANRLREAREKRLRENPPKYANIHPSVLEKGDDAFLTKRSDRQRRVPTFQALFQTRLTQIAFSVNPIVHRSFLDSICFRVMFFFGDMSF